MGRAGVSLRSWSFLLSAFGWVGYVKATMTFSGRPAIFTLRQIAGLGLAVWGAFLAGCAAPQQEASEKPERFEFQQPHMGTMFTITLYASNAVVARSASEAAFAKIAGLDRLMTDYDPDSELMRLCRCPVGEPTRVSDELFHILQEAQRIAELTGGAFDVTIGPVVRLWRRARRAEILPAPAQLARARESVGWQKLRLDSATRTVTLTVPNMQLDLGGIAKGHAADQALAVLREHGCSRALVAASGDIAVGDPPPGQRGWRVEIGALGNIGGEPPRVLLLAHAAVSTSGDTEQFVEIGGKRYSHIVDPRTGVGLTERLLVSIIAPRATQTDAFATAVSVLGLERGLVLIESQPGMAGLLVHCANGDEKVITSERWSREAGLPPGQNLNGIKPSR